MISIIIPTLNEEKRLSSLLESVRRQKFSDLEVIIGDAGSTDATLSIAERYGCRVVAGGLPAKGKNEGTKIAKGDLLLFLDADVVLPIFSSGKSFFERILNEFKKRDLSLGSFFLKPYQDISNNGVKCSWFRFLLFSIFYNIPVMIIEKILPHAAMGIMVKKEVFERAGGFDEDIFLAEDHYLSRKVKKIGKCGFFTSAIIFVSDRRFDKDGWMKTFSKYLLAELYMIFKGPIKKDIFKYKFNHYSKEEK